MSPTYAPETTTPTAARTVWHIDPVHTLVELSAKHMMFTTVKGRFTGVRGTVREDPADVRRSSVTIEIDAATITTGDAQRDAHLRSADFLDVDSNPTISFRSTRIEGSPDRFRLIGDLTIRGATREIALDAEFVGRATNPFGKDVAGYTATGQISRKEYGLTWNVGLETGGVLVGDTIKISLDVQVVRAEE
jgi:polyisoprenoid-binding protein YceI